MSFKNIDIATKYEVFTSLKWLVGFLWHIKLCRLFKAKFRLLFQIIENFMNTLVLITLDITD